jgi:dipeptide/tripeptide permease
MMDNGRSATRANAPRTAGEIVAMLLVAVSIAVCICVAIDGTQSFLAGKAQGSETGWLEGLFGGAILVCGPSVVALWLALRRRPAPAACFAILGLMMAGASWVGMRA